MAGSSTRYGSKPGGMTPKEVRPAWILLGTACCCALVSVLSLAVDANWSEYVGYASAIASLVVLIGFRFVNRARQSAPGYIGSLWVGRVALCAILLALVGLIFGALRLARQVPV